MIKHNFVKEKIKRGEAVIGTWNTMNSPIVTDVLASAGLDFIFIDHEHGSFDFTQAVNFVNAADKYNCSSIFRIPTFEDWMVLQVLDQGAHGVMIPHVENKNDVNLFIDSTKYHPIGNRGYSPFTPAGGYSNIASSNYTDVANNFTLTSIIIENSLGINNLDEILENEHLDVVYLGAYDLSADLGVPGEVKHKKVIDLFKKAISKITNAGKSPGGFVAKNQDDIKWLLDLGIKFIPYQVDCGILYENTLKITEWFHKETK